MPNGYGRGFGGRGWGFGFRGSSPPWPYVGIGRGGLPRCGYFLSGAAGMPAPPGYPAYGSPGAMPYVGMAYPGATPYDYARASMGAEPYGPRVSREQELDFLRNQAGALESELDAITRRLEELSK
jgi:hypothetical protein